MRPTTWRGSLMGAAVLAGAMAIAIPAHAEVNISIGGWFNLPLPIFGPPAYAPPPVAYVPPPVYVAPQPIVYAPPAYPLWYRRPGHPPGHYKHGWKHCGPKHWHGGWD